MTYPASGSTTVLTSLKDNKGSRYDEDVVTIPTSPPPSPQCTVSSGANGVVTCIYFYSSTLSNKIAPTASTAVFVNEAEAFYAFQTSTLYSVTSSAAITLSRAVSIYKFAIPNTLTCGVASEGSLLTTALESDSVKYCIKITNLASTPLTTFTVYDDNGAPTDSTKRTSYSLLNCFLSSGTAVTSLAQGTSCYITHSHTWSGFTRYEDGDWL